MGLETRELVEYTLRCDRCGKTEVFTSEVEYEGEPQDFKQAFQEGWQKLERQRPFGSDIYFCPLDSSKFSFWVEGQGTPASIRYNDEEESRFERARAQIDPFNEHGPWDD